MGWPRPADRTYSTVCPLCGQIVTSARENSSNRRDTYSLHLSSQHSGLTVREASLNADEMRRGETLP